MKLQEFSLSEFEWLSLGQESWAGHKSQEEELERTWQASKNGQV